MEDIEGKLKQLDANKCRSCTHFIRVNTEAVSKVTGRQGFCLYGQFEGDYSLYISTS